MEGYTARELTFETDRLPAIAGIARKIQDITGDTYMAGLWKNDLGAGLCWRIRGFGDLCRPSRYRAPSWSWAALEGSITHRIPEEHKLSAKLITFEIKTDENNPFGEVLSGQVVLSGCLRTFQVAQGTVGIELIESDEKHRRMNRLVSHEKQESVNGVHLYGLRDQGSVTDPWGTGMCEIYFDLEPPDSIEQVVLFQLLANDHEVMSDDENGTFIPHGIVLEKAGSHEDWYQRIGMYSITDASGVYVLPGAERAALGDWIEKTVTII